MKALLILIAILSLNFAEPLIENAPQFEQNATAKHEISVKFESPKKYMQKYLPSNLKVSNSASISVIYEFSNNHNGDKKLEFFKSIEMQNISEIQKMPNFEKYDGRTDKTKPAKVYDHIFVGNLRFFDQKGHKLEFSAVYRIVEKDEEFRKFDLKKVRNQCIEGITANLENQINLAYERGDFNVFK